MSIRKRMLLVLLFFLLFSFQVSAANLFIPSLELITRGYAEDGLFKLATRGDIDFLIEGGYKFGGEIKLNIFSSDLLTTLTGTGPNLNPIGDTAEIAAYLNQSNFLTFESAKIEIRELFGIHLDFSFFIGQTASFCSGDIFTDVFGDAYIGSKLRGYLYFPDAIEFNGIHTVNGTGFSLETDFGNEKLNGALYFYQDAYMDSGIYSADVNFAIDLDQFKIELFAGATFPDGPYGTYRGGFLLYYKPSEVGEFLTEIGIPRITPGTDQLNIQMFYFLFEPRINLSFMSIIPTFFWHPMYYLQQDTGQTGAIDLNINFQFGNLEKSPLTAGLETTFSFGSSSAASFEALGTPYISFISSGVQWDIKAVFQLFPFNLSELVEGYIGITAEF